MDIDREIQDRDAKLDRAVELITEAFAARSIRHALIGGLATSLRGRQRTTKDVDLLVEVSQLSLPGLLEDLVARGFSLDPAVVARQYTQQHITSFLFQDVRIDWLKPILPIYARAIADAEPMDWSLGHSVRVATAEGIILTKLVAFREQDQMDIKNLLIANYDTIDADLIRNEWAPFAASEPERTAWLDAAIEKHVVRGN